MIGSQESATNSPARIVRTGEKILICGVNWVGDTIISMPAIQTFRKANPEAHITLLVKESLKSLWNLHAAPDRIVCLASGVSGTWETACRLRWEKFGRAYILPHSFRSALIPWLARIPERIGMPGHSRDLMLTKVVKPGNRPDRPHQTYEYFDLMTPETSGENEVPPELFVREEEIQKARELLSCLPQPWVGLIPGAARGPSKQWPKQHFLSLGRVLSNAHGCGLVLFGTADESSLCQEIADGIGAHAINLAGKTSFKQWLALMAICRVIVANDSGGMHIASALGRPVVALYGLTDPDKTGPLGRRHRIHQKSTVRCRDVARDSEEARKSLASITPDEVLESVKSFLNANDRTPE